MFDNHNTNLNKWFVSPYRTLYQRYKNFFFFRKTKSKSQEDGHDNEVNLLKKKIISRILKSSALENKMSWNMTKPTKSHIYSKDW